MYGFDHLLMAVHTDAADALLPYSLELEDVSWWYSEYVVNLAAAGLLGLTTLCSFMLSLPRPTGMAMYAAHTAPCAVCM